MPNPVMDSITVGLENDGGAAEMVLYDLSGRPVEFSVSVPTAPGRHEISYDTSGLPSGVYVVRLTADGVALTRRLVIAR